MRPSLLVFGLLCCLYLLTAGGQGYSVDGTFSYELARSLATDPGRDFLAHNRETLKRWGPVVPALGTPLAWLGARLGEWAPRPDTVVAGGSPPGGSPFGGRPAAATLRLYDWPALVGPAGARSADGRPASAGEAPSELVLPLSRPVAVSQLRLVSFLSFASELADGTPVAELILRADAGGSPAGGSPAVRQDSSGGPAIRQDPGGGAAAGAAAPVAGETRVTLRAGVDTAEWAYDIATAQRPRHSRAPVVGHWPGNPSANLYLATLPVSPPAAVSSVAVRYVAPVGRLHLRSVVVSGPEGDVAAPGPATWSAEQQDALFTRFGFSFLNAPLMAMTGALLVSLARLLGYSTRAAVTLGTGFGVATLAWPYAKHDFSEVAAGTFAVAATALVLAAGRTPPGSRAGSAAALAAGSAAALAAGAKYTAAWFIPLLAIQLALAWLRASRVKDQGSRVKEAPRNTPAGGEPPPGQGSPAGTPAFHVSRFTSHASRLTLHASGFTSHVSLAIRLAAILAPPLVAAAVAGGLAGGAPTLWAGWRAGLGRGWLDFPLWAGLYGLLLSPGKSVFLYAPPLALSVLGAPAFLRRHRELAFVFLAAPLLYILVFAGKGVWHGGGWGPRYLVPAIPFAACLALPAIERAGSGRSPRVSCGGAVLLMVGLAAQVLGVAKHPNLYTIMFRDHVLPSLPDYGAPLGGPPALAYWRHFGGPAADRQLARPPAGDEPPGAPAVRQHPSARTPVNERPPRGLGYLFAERGPLQLRLDVQQDGLAGLTAYVCDWDRRGRRQVIRIVDAAGPREYAQDYAFSGCEYLSWTVALRRGEPVTVQMDATGADVPVLSGLFFDPPREERLAGAPPSASTPAASPVNSKLETRNSIAGAPPSARTTEDGQQPPRRDTATRGDWPGRYGTDGFVLFAWLRGGQDVRRLPAYVAGYSGGERVWIDTGEADLADTALLYAPAFSPLAAHAWLLGTDAVFALFPGNAALQQRALASPPWRYLAGLGIQPPHPEYGLGLDFWPLLLYAQLSSHGGFMRGVWAVAGALGLGVVAFGIALIREAGRAGPAQV